MKYLCLVCVDERKLSALSGADLRRLDRDNAAYNAALAKRGRCIAAAALKPVETATTVRMKNGKPTVADGPYAETREQVGGFILIDAANLDEAIEIAANIPVVRWGCVEIRAAKEATG